jgi:outer membrane immunogenic protein
MRKLFVAIGIFASTVVAAQAQSGRAFSWTGFYVGANVGYAWGDVDVRDTNGGVPPGPFNYDVDGFSGGVQIGYNMQVDRLVAGIELEGGYMDLGGQGRIASSNPAAFQRIDLNGGAYGILSGRLGVTFGSSLFYGKAGWAYFDGDAGQKTTNPGYVTHRTGAFSGAVYGGGWEHAFGGNWSVRVEYLHFNFGTEGGDQTSVSDPPIGFVYNNKHDLSADTVKFGLNYKF